jgi:hypothetical protein
MPPKPPNEKMFNYGEKVFVKPASEAVLVPQENGLLLPSFGLTVTFSPYYQRRVLEQSVTVEPAKMEANA